jgi:hypothetical protein
MHKVRSNYGSCTWGLVKMHPTTVETSGKGEDGVKPGWNSVEHRKWSILEFDPQLKANVLFWRFFFDLTQFSTTFNSTCAVFPWVYGKHCETPWKLVPACFNTPSKNIQLIPSEVFKKSVSNGQVIFVWENLRFSLRELKKWKPPNTGFYLRLHSSISSTTLEMTWRVFFPIQV